MLAALDRTSDRSSTGDSIWRLRPFLLAFSGAITFEVGAQFCQLALPLIVYSLNQAAVEVNGVRAIMFMPNLLLAFAIGAIVDAVSKTRLLMVSLACQIAALALMFLVLLLPGNHLWFVYGLTFILSLFSYAYYNALTVVVKYIVPNTLIGAAVSMFTASRTALYIVGPALAGIVLWLSDYRYGLLLSCVPLALTGIILLPLRIPPPTRRFTVSSVAANLSAGWAEFLRNRALRYISFCALLFNMAGGIYEIDVIFFMKDTLHLSSAVLGLVLSSAGIGGILGSAVATRARAKCGLGPLLATTAVGSGSAYALLAIYGTLPVAVAVVFVEGAFTATFIICVASFRQESTPAHLMGAIAGLTGSLFKLGVPFAVFFAGWLVDVTNVRFAFWCSAALSYALALLLLGHPLLRRQA